MSTPAHLIPVSVEIDKEEIRKLFMYNLDRSKKSINLELKIQVSSTGDCSEYFTGELADGLKISVAILTGKLKIHAEKTPSTQ